MFVQKTIRKDTSQPLLAYMAPYRGFIWYRDSMGTVQDDGPSNPETVILFNDILLIYENSNKCEGDLLI